MQKFTFGIHILLKNRDSIILSQNQFTLEMSGLFDTMNTELECEGLQSLIDKIQQRNGLSSTKILKQEYFNFNIFNLEDISNDFIWQANISDLWKILEKFLNHQEIKDLFEAHNERSKQLIHRICSSIRIIRQKQLAGWFISNFPQKEECYQKLQKLLHHKQKIDENKLPTSSKLYLKTILPFLQMNKVSFDDFKKFMNNQEQIFDKKIYKKFQQSVINYIYTKIRKSIFKNTEIGYSIRLILLYLKIDVDNQSYYQLFISDISLSSTYMNFLSQSNGILKLLRIFEDSLSVEIIKREYQYTKKIIERQMN